MKDRALAVRISVAYDGKTFADDTFDDCHIALDFYTRPELCSIVPAVGSANTEQQIAISGVYFATVSKQY